MATGPREKQRRLVDTTNTNKNFYAKKTLNKSINSRDIPPPLLLHRQFSTGENNSPPPPSPKAFDTVASDDSSSLNRLRPVVSRNGTEFSLPGYVQFDNKVRISLNNGSKSVIRELKRKLVGELDRVRSLKTKLEAAEFHSSSGYNDNAGLMTSCSNNRVGTLARVNSEVSYVGPPDPGSVQRLARSVDGSSVGGKVDKVKKTPKIDQHRENPGSGIRKGGKVSNSASGGKKGSVGKVTERESKMDRDRRDMIKRCGVLLEKLMKHQYGWVFNKPVDVKRLNLHDYHKIIKRPMDLGTVNGNLRKNWYKSPKGFAEDVRLTFNNAKTYNEKGQDAHIMADVLLKLFEEEWAALKAEYDYDERFEMGRDRSSKPLTSNRNPAPRNAAPLAPVSAPPLKNPSETRLLDPEEVVTKAKPVGSNTKGSNIVTDEGKTQLSEKPEENEPWRRDMTFKEKQILSAKLLDLPSEKLGTVVQIIKKRNPGLCQEEDEIEVDIDSFDSETLWELDRFVSNRMNDSGNNTSKGEPVLQTKEVGPILQETNLTSTSDRALEVSDAAEKIATRSPMVREEQNNVSRSSSSGSSSGEAGSSSSDSDSSSSGYRSDAGR